MRRVAPPGRSVVFLLYDRSRDRSRHRSHALLTLRERTVRVRRAALWNHGPRPSSCIAMSPSDRRLPSPSLVAARARLGRARGDAERRPGPRPPRRDGRGRTASTGAAATTCSRAAAGPTASTAGRATTASSAAPGNDRLVGGPGNDLLAGDAGARHAHRRPRRRHRSLGGAGNDRISAATPGDAARRDRRGQRQRHRQRARRLARPDLVRAGPRPRAGRPAATSVGRDCERVSRG